MALIYDPLAWLEEAKAEGPEKGATKVVKGVTYRWTGTKWAAVSLPGQATQTNTGNGGSASSGGSSGGGSSGGGGGSSAGEGLSAYIQEYRLRFNPGGDPPKNLVALAKQNNWSLAYFDQQVRLKDPAYFKSIEARGLLAEFSKTMKVLFPGLAAKGAQAKLMKSPFYRKVALWYLKNGIGMQRGGEEALYSHITSTKQWNRANPEWKTYARNANVGVAVGADPVMFKQLHDALKQSFGDAGVEMPDEYYNSFFRSRYASKSGMNLLSENLKQYAQQGKSFGWMEGREMSGTEQKSLLFGQGPKQADLRSRLAKSFGVRGSFLSGESKGTETTLGQGNKLLKPLL